MESVLVRERYKIARVLEAADGYAFAEAVDIADRETSVRLLNIYEGEWLPVYARIFADMNVCPAFCEAFLSGDSLTAVFQSSRAWQSTTRDLVFTAGADWSWQDRMTFAGQLLHRALELADLLAGGRLRGAAVGQCAGRDGGKAGIIALPIASR